MGWLERMKKASAAQWEIAEDGTNSSADFDLVYRIQRRECQFLTMRCSQP